MTLPTIIAKAKAINGANRIESIVRGASSLASSMYAKFRETGIFVANDAWYVAYDHPDSGLRGALEVTYPIMRDNKIVDLNGFDAIVDHIISTLIETDVSLRSNVQVILSYKLSYDSNYFKRMAELTLEKYSLSTLCVLSESALSAIVTSQNSALVLNVGAKVSTVTPVYENIVMRKCSASTNVGGEYVTEFLELLIDGRCIEAYSALLPRRRRQFARMVKEKHAFVALSFQDAKREYGEFNFEYVQVFASDVEDNTSSLKNMEATVTDKTKSIVAKETFALNNGQQLAIEVDKELFYCSELLFSPVIHEACENEKSVVEAILEVVELLDDSVREEICRNVVVTGKTSLMQGFENRLRSELATEFAKFGIDHFVITMAEKDSELSAVWDGVNMWVSGIASSKQIEGRNILSSKQFQLHGPSSLYELD